MSTLYDLDPEWPASRKAVYLAMHSAVKPNEVTPVEIADALGMSLSSAWVNLRSLAESGHINRRAFLDEDEKKQVAYSLPTAKGATVNEDPPSDD